MKQFLKRLVVGIFLALPWIGAASAQQTNMYCVTNPAAPPYQWTPCQTSSPLATTAVSNGVVQGVTAAGSAARVTQDPTQIFWDDFGSGTLDSAAAATLNHNWVTPTTGGGGNATAATNQVGFTILGSGNQASGWSVLSSQKSFRPANPGWLYFQEQNNIEFPVLLNALRFFGFGTFPGSPTTAAPYTNVVGFEVGTDGKLRAVTAASGSRTIIADLSVACTSTAQCGSNIVGKTPQPQDGNAHKYVIYFRGDNIFWTIDGIDNVVAYTTTGANGPDVNTLPLGHLAVAGATPPSSTATIQINMSNVGDTGRNEQRICDPIYSWLCANVNTAGQLTVVNTPSSVAAAGITPVVSGAAEASHVLKASPGNLYGVYISSPSASGFLMVFNSTTVPVDGAVTPLECLPVSASNVAFVNFIPGPPEVYSIGISAALSSTGCFTKTTSPTGFFHGFVQ